MRRKKTAKNSKNAERYLRAAKGTERQKDGGKKMKCEPHPDGSIRLVPVVPRQQQRVVARLVKGHFEVPPGYRLDSEAIGRAIAEEQESRA